MNRETKIKRRYRNLVSITSDVDYPRNIEIIVDSSNNGMKIKTFKPNGSYMRDDDKKLFMLGNERITINGILGRVDYVKVSDSYPEDNNVQRVLQYERVN